MTDEDIGWLILSLTPAIIFIGFILSRLYCAWSQTKKGKRIVSFTIDENGNYEPLGDVPK